MPTAITGTGLFTPPFAISNEELVASFNAWVEAENERNADAIARGDEKPLETSSAEFIVNASGIKSRYVMDKEGVLDPAIMARAFPNGPTTDVPPGEIAAAAGATRSPGAALAGSDRRGHRRCSNLQRAYPAIAVEVQDELGARGFAFDMNVGCSSAAFAMSVAPT